MLNNSTQFKQPRHALIIGGSLGGLLVGNVLRSIGWNVSIYERSTSNLYKRGAGIVLQPQVRELYDSLGLPFEDLTIASKNLVKYDPLGNRISQEEATQVQTSWSFMYKSLRDNFPDEHYHQGKALTHIKQNGQRVTAFFQDGTHAEGDLLIGADGSRSTVRWLMAAANQPEYAGYIAWRGMLNHEVMPEEARELLFDFASSTNVQSHILGYSIPNSDSGAYNWVWYRPIDEQYELQDLMTDLSGREYAYAIPPGTLSDKWLDRMHADAAQLLPPSFRAAVQATPKPFAQAILDLTS
ncbi:MAG: FAD-dependent monooxygenase, partial [Chloroflexota bacterium]